MQKNNKRMTIDKLAVMVQKGFLGLEEKIEKEVLGMRKEIRGAKDELKSDILNVQADLNKKVDIFKHNDLKFRVERLEEKVGIARKK